MTNLQQFIRDEHGQNVVEYGLLIATITTWFTSLATRITTT